MTKKNQINPEQNFDANIIPDLSNQDELRKAIISAEILKPKYC